jgi:nucleoside-diphosphate-sugar epimerase
MRPDARPAPWPFDAATLRDPGLIVVVGASGRSGAALCHALSAEGARFVPVVRDPAKWEAIGLPETSRIADLSDAPALAMALAGAGTVVSTAHASWTPAILAAAPPDAGFVLMGSTRRFSRWPDAHGDGVRAGETAFLASGRRGAMLHPTLIYGRSGQGDVNRLAALLARLPVAPLPGGGRALVQPIHQSDVTRCLLAAMRCHWEVPEAVVIAGSAPMPYRDFLRAVAAATGLRAPPVLTVPAAVLRALAPVSALVPGLPRIGADEIRRLAEDKAFDITRMRTLLGVAPVPLDAGLAMTFPQRDDSA